jgi:signal transduction histidine kinase/CheY-like chemotaxis protein/CHASE3 domain sensor protein/HPt (histidine-containing phosphotransfer) domain-containing protein
MMKISLPVKISTLMVLAIALISATGYLSFRSLSSIVASVQVKSKPDQRLLTIREISNDLERAESSVRMFIHTHDQHDIEPYYATIGRFDEKINSLRDASAHDTTLLTQIDTVSRLMEDNIVNWNEMLNLYHNDSIDNFMRRISDQLTLGAKAASEKRSILKRVFGRKPKPPVDQEQIIQNLHNMEKQDSIKNSRLRATEAQLAAAGAQIREHFYVMIAKMESEVVLSLRTNARAADALAQQTYQWLAMFMALGTLLVIVTVIIVVRFARTTRNYQKALIRSRDETEKLSATRERFMANMSHEIRTPVNAIYGFTEQLMYRTFDNSNRRILDIIKSSSDHLVKLVNDILDFSKLQNEKIELEPVHFHILRVCEEVQLLFENKALEKDTRLYFTIGETVPPVLYGDSYRLKQILFNLVGNSVKFTTDGEIRFTVDAGITEDGGISLVIAVADTGIGIREEMQSRVFEDFTQEESDTTQKYGGTGLGLSIVKKLVELHGGTVKLESAKNKGTRITCVMPYARGDAAQIVERGITMQIPEWFTRLSILIVDDEAYNRLLFKTILDRWKVRYDEADDGFKALEMLRMRRYDVVFMDMRMPGLDGLEATVRIRQELGKDGAELPIIGISATHTTEDVLAYKKAGMNTFLPKPFTERMLLDVMLASMEAKPQVPVQAVPEIDLTDLFHLANHDMPFVRQMLQQFILSTETGLGELDDAVEKGQTETARATAHKISAPCNHVGARVLYARLKAIENLDPALPAREKALQQLCREARLEFEAVKNILELQVLKMSDS